MNQHPIPQNISTYQFRLIGDMTLKQFLQIVVGLGIAIALFKTNLFFLLKWPLIFLAVFSGFAAAFLPIQERPLEQWLNAFLKAIYAPTQYLWGKGHELPQYFSFVPHASVLTVDEMKTLSEMAITKKRLGLSSYLQTLSDSAVSPLDQAEADQITRSIKLFSTAPTPPLTLKPLEVPVAPPANGVPKMVVVPAAAPTAVTKTTHPAPAPAPRPQTLYPAPPKPLHTLVKQTAASTGVAPTESRDLPFPSLPTIPNTIIGMVLDPVGRLVENAIIEIRSSDGLPVRATKTNRLGQFASNTPLKNGTYELEIDAPGHTFAIIKLDLRGQVIQPLKIQAQS
ncbi:hypothetical protein A2W24_00370 [Microgenomates group bacterium RBG_16_45_19]|nr:MAG: hypothetical protein A2W24_00370 [Microgenomates group bacterium RBG_16_45_19]